MTFTTHKKQETRTTCIDFECEGQVYTCACTASRRRSYAVSVKQDGTLEVRYPLRTPMFAVRMFISSKRGWIEQKLKEVHSAGVVIPLQGKDGETLFVGGVEKRLEIRTHTKTYIEHEGNIVRVFAKKTEPQYILKKVMGWYKTHAEVLFEARLKEIAQSFGITDVPVLQIKNLKGRWGSMSPHNTMTLSLALAAAPVEALDQVIAHELVHLKHRHHKKSFYKELEKQYPKWREHNKLLLPKYMLK